MENNKKSERLWSLDALRGFDMLFIMGFAPFVVAICNFWPECGVAQWCAQQMGHVEWNGLAHHDTIFPLFLFIAGISFPFSIAKQRSMGHTDAQIFSKIVKRGLILIFLGMVYNGLFMLNFEKMRYASVLGRIGLAWMISAILFTNFKTKPLIITAVSILVGYWLVMWLVPGGSEPYSLENNLAGKIDRVLCPGRLYVNNMFDPEGLFSTIPAIVTAMLGMFTGQFVRLPETKISGSKKARYMFFAAIAFTILGIIWNYAFPINKNLWSSSFVCVLAGYSLFLFSLFYYIIDIKKHRSLTLFFRVIGMNSITIYMAQRIVDFDAISNFFLCGVLSDVSPLWSAVISTAGYLLVSWLFLYFLYKHKIFLKV